MKLNQLPEDFEGEQKRQTEFDSPAAKLAYDAKGLIAKAKLQSERLGQPVDPITFAQRNDDDIDALRATIAKEQKAVNSTTEAAPVESQKHKLTPEQAEATLRTLEARFQTNEYLHKEVKFKNVRKALESNPEALWSVAQMEAQGHEPDVYNSDKKGFDIGTCSKESPVSARNCVYDKEAADWSRKNGPDQVFSGSAVEMAEAMGINLMDQNSYEKILQKKGRFDLLSYSWLLTPSDIRLTGSDIRLPGLAIGGTRRGERVYVERYGVCNHSDGEGFRGSLRVPWKRLRIWTLIN